MSYECDVCGRTFANASNRLRHKKVVHANKIPSVKRRTLTVNGVAVLQHPFTCIVAVCTQSGKTVWVKTLLENVQKIISPTPQRIIWCYGQWQPTYFDMMRTMPGMEFNEGIPDDIDESDYLDVSQRNLIVLDDLMAQSGKDKRIADLFTRGSHHRNQLNRFLTFKNKLDFPAHPIAKASVQEAPPTPVEMAQLNEPAHVTPRVPVTPKSNFLAPPNRRGTTKAQA